MKSPCESSRNFLMAKAWSRNLYWPTRHPTKCVFTQVKQRSIPAENADRSVPFENTTKKDKAARKNSEWALCHCVVRVALVMQCVVSCRGD